MTWRAIVGRTHGPRLSTSHHPVSHCQGACRARQLFVRPAAQAAACCRRPRVRGWH